MKYDFILPKESDKMSPNRNKLYRICLYVLGEHEETVFSTGNPEMALTMSKQWMRGGSGGPKDGFKVGTVLLLQEWCTDSGTNNLQRNAGLNGGRQEKDTTSPH